MRRRFVAGLFLLVLLMVAAVCVYAFWPRFSQNEPGIAIQPAGDVPADVMADVREAAAGFSRLADDAGVPLAHGVTLFVAPTQEDYERVLTQQFSHSEEEAAKISEISGGWTGGKQGKTALNGAAGVMQGRSDRMSTTAHELFHQLQYDLSHGNDAAEQALFWLEEGSADYVGALVAEQCGGKSLHKWEQDTMFDLRRAQETVNAKELVHCSPQRRMQLMEKKYHSYQLADAMVICLVQKQAKGTELAAIVRYFRALADTRSGEEAFSQAFGMTHAQFLQEFQQWYVQERHLPFAAHVIARSGVSAALAADVKTQAAAVQPMLAGMYGQRLCGRYDLILAADAADFIQAIAENCAVTQDKARELASGSLWIQDGSTIIVQAGELGDGKQRIFSVGALCARLLETQVADKREESVAWLDRGIIYLAGIRALEQAGQGRYADYRRGWQQAVRRAGAVPSLEQLLTADGMREASESYGDDIVNELAEFAADELMTRFGWSSYRAYLQQVRRLGSEREAFREVYGRDTAAYARELELARTSRR